jgi:hypothetical protein
MKIPKSIKIGGATYKIVYSKAFDDGKQQYGEIDYTKRLITLRKCEAIDHIFLHEVVHGMFHFIQKEQNEEEVDRLAQVLLSVIVDNPNLFNNKEE